jgi:aminoglycoside N3'-acetyltransferase
MSMMVSDQAIRVGIRELGLSSRPICVHASLRSFGHVEGSASTVVRSFQEEGCTLLVPSFSWTFAVSPPAHLCPPRNGWTYRESGESHDRTGSRFLPTSDEIDKDMGQIAAEVLRQPDRSRGNHPLCSFTAAGPLAVKLIANQTPANVYAPLEALAQENGFVLLMGSDLSR